MRVLGFDPGATTGWCVYDTDRMAADAAGEFRGFAIPVDVLLHAQRADAVVVESFTQVLAGIYPATVQAAYTCGRIVERIENGTPHEVVEMSRLDVKKVLNAAVHGEVNVKNNSTAWAALVLLHGDGSDVKPTKKNGGKGGALGIVTGHGRAALAVAVAYVLRERQEVA